MNRPFGFGKREKNDKDRIDSSSVMLRVAVVDSHGAPSGEPRAMLFDRKDTVSDVLNKAAARMELATTDSLSLYRATDTHSLARPLKASKPIADCRVHNNAVVYLMHGSREPSKEKEKHAKDKKKNAPSSHTAQPHSAVFGRPLSDFAKECGPDDVPYPEFLERALDYLEDRATEAEGIFRLSGTASEISAYKEALDRGEDVDFDNENNLHNVTGLVKLYLRELPEPLLTWAFFFPFMAVQEEANEQRRVSFVRMLVTCLPAPNYTLLKRLCGFFFGLEVYRDVTKMHYENLATVLGPNILRRQGETALDIFAGAAPVNAVTHLLLSYYNEIFEGPEELSIVGCAVAQHDWQPTNADELKIIANDIVFIESDNGSDGWWTGYCKGSYGFFPSNYVEMCCSVPASRRPPPLPATTNELSSSREDEVETKAETVSSSQTLCELVSEIDRVKAERLVCEAEVETLTNVLASLHSEVAQLESTQNNLTSSQ